MAWRVFGEWYSTAAMSDTSISQPVIFNDNLVLRSCRIWIIAYNDPSFTSLSMKIYSDNSGSPKKLLHTSTNSPTKAEIITSTNGIKEIYFEFNYPVFKSTDTYQFVLNATGYTGTSSSHLAWRKAWPDPVYRTNVTSTYPKLGVAPYAITFVGADL